MKIASQKQQTEKLKVYSSQFLVETADKLQPKNDNLKTSAAGGRA